MSYWRLVEKQVKEVDDKLKIHTKTIADLDNEMSDIKARVAIFERSIAPPFDLRGIQQKLHRELVQKRNQTTETQIEATVTLEKLKETLNRLKCHCKRFVCPSSGIHVFFSGSEKRKSSLVCPAHI